MQFRVMRSLQVSVHSSFNLICVLKISPKTAAIAPGAATGVERKRAPAVTTLQGNRLVRGQNSLHTSSPVTSRTRRSGRNGYEIDPARYNLNSKRTRQKSRH